MRVEGGDKARPTPWVTSALFRRAVVTGAVALLAALAFLIANAYSPNDWTFLGVQLLSVIFIISSSVAAVIGVLKIWAERPESHDPILFLLVLTLSVFLLHIYTINEPPTSSCYDTTKKVFGCIMDEVYYVPAAQTLLAGTRCQPYADACNLEHPYLAKALSALGIYLFKLTDFGWRILPTILGTLSIPLLFAITYLLSRNLRIAYFASLLLAFDTLFFVHSGAALIDVPP